MSNIPPVRSSVITYGYRVGSPLTDDISIGSDWVQRPYYRIRLSNLNRVGEENFSTTTGDYELDFQLDNVPSAQLIRVLEKIFQELFFIVCHNKASPSCNEQFVRLVIQSEALGGSQGGKVFHFKRLALNNPEESVDLLLDYLERTLQSNESLLTSNLLRVNFISYTPKIRPDKKTTRFSRKRKKKK